MVKKYTSSSGLVIVFLEELLKAGEEEQFPHDIMLNAFREVFPNMLKDFSLRHAQDNSYQRQKTGQEKRRVAEGQGSPYLATSAKRSIENWKIASVLCKYLTLGLDSEFDQLISKILVETYAIPIGHYDEVLLPLLKVFLKILLEKEADLTKPRVRLLFQQGLAIYIDRYIRPEPRKPTDWTRYARECLCEYCVELNSFLLDPNMQQCRFTKNFGVRMHLQSQLSADEDDYKVETDMSSAAHTLVITKTSACSQYLRESIAWKSRSAAASQKIRSLGLGPLRELLGDQFDAIINLIWVKLGSGDQGDGRMSHTAQAPVEDPEVITIE